MSEPPSSASRRGSMRRAADLSTRVALPLGVFAVVLAVFFGERAIVDHELQLLSPAAAPPGSTIAVRAFLFERLHAIDGPHLAAAPVEVRLVDGAGAVRARTQLAPSPAGGAEGALALPPELSGRLALEAVARVEGEPVASARAALDVRVDPPAAALLGRLRTELQRLAVGPLEALAAAPPQLDVRVAGAACVPEHPCRVLVHVGEPAAAVRLEPSASVTPGLPSRHDPLGATTGLVELPVVVHGPEARTELVATRDGVEVARRTVQLPVALATPGVTLASRVLSPDQPVVLTAYVLGDRPGVVVDAYRSGHWVRTGSFAPSGAAPRALPLALEPALEPGVWRLQVHTDPFASDRSAVRMIVVRAPGEDDAGALARLVAELGQPEPPPGPLPLRLAWVAAPEEEGMHVLPGGASGLEADLARLEARRGGLRVAAVVALALGLVVAAILFVRRGVESALEAHRVMDATGDPTLTSRRYRRRTLLSALAIVVTVLLAFVGAAALVVARARLLE